MAPPAILFWIGPVTADNLAGVRWNAPVGVVVSQCGGSAGGSTHCYARGRLLAEHPAGPLEALAAAAGVELAPGRGNALASFSAGFGMVDWILRDPHSRDRLGLVVLADSYYSAPGTSVPKPGIAAYAREAIEGRGRIVATTGGDLAEPQNQSAGAAFRVLADALALGPPESAAGWDARAEFCRRSGGVSWIHYGRAVSHVRHATEIAPRTLQAVQGAFVGPRQEKAIDTGGGWADLAKLGLVLAALGALGARWPA